MIKTRLIFASISLFLLSLMLQSKNKTTRKITVNLPKPVVPHQQDELSGSASKPEREFGGNLSSSHATIS